jgi:hypothetical protein
MEKQLTEIEKRLKELEEEIEYYTIAFIRCEDVEMRTVLENHIEKLQKELEELEAVV